VLWLGLVLPRGYAIGPPSYLSKSYWYTCSKLLFLNPMFYCIMKKSLHVIYQ